MENHHSSFSKSKRRLFVLTLWMLTLFTSGYTSAQEQGRIIRLAKLQIDSTQLEPYKAALKEEIETSVRVEPGVLTLYAVADKDHPTRITIFEIYASMEAYNAHRETPHFKKYKSITKEMVKSLDLTDAVPILMEAKASGN